MARPLVLIIQLNYFIGVFANNKEHMTDKR